MARTRKTLVGAALAHPMETVGLANCKAAKKAR
jgi:hypothetical protein